MHSGSRQVPISMDMRREYQMRRAQAQAQAQASSSTNKLTLTRPQSSSSVVRPLSRGLDRKPPKTPTNFSQTAPLESFEGLQIHQLQGMERPNSSKQHIKMRPSTSESVLRSGQNSSINSSNNSSLNKGSIVFNEDIDEVSQISSIDSVPKQDLNEISVLSQDNTILEFENSIEPHLPSNLPTLSNSINFGSIAHLSIGSDMSESIVLDKLEENKNGNDIQNENESENVQNIKSRKSKKNTNPLTVEDRITSNINAASIKGSLERFRKDVKSAGGVEEFTYANLTDEGEVNWKDDEEEDILENLRRDRIFYDIWLKKHGINEESHPINVEVVSKLQNLLTKAQYVSLMNSDDDISSQFSQKKESTWTSKKIHYLKTLTMAVMDTWETISKEMSDQYPSISTLRDTIIPAIFHCENPMDEHMIPITQPPFREDIRDLNNEIDNKIESKNNNNETEDCNIESSSNKTSLYSNKHLVNVYNNYLKESSEIKNEDETEDKRFETFAEKWYEKEQKVKQIEKHYKELQEEQEKNKLENKKLQDIIDSNEKIIKALKQSNEKQSKELSDLKEQYLKKDELWREVRDKLEEEKKNNLIIKNRVKLLEQDIVQLNEKIAQKNEEILLKDRKDEENERQLNTCKKNIADLKKNKKELNSMINNLINKNHFMIYFFYFKYKKVFKEINQIITFFSTKLKPFFLVTALPKVAKNSGSFGSNITITVEDEPLVRKSKFSEDEDEKSAEDDETSNVIVLNQPLSVKEFNKFDIDEFNNLYQTEDINDISNTEEIKKLKEEKEKKEKEEREKSEKEKKEKKEKELNSTADRSKIRKLNNNMYHLNYYMASVFDESDLPLIATSFNNLEAVNEELFDLCEHPENFPTIEVQFLSTFTPKTVKKDEKKKKEDIPVSKSEMIVDSQTKKRQINIAITTDDFSSLSSMKFEEFYSKFPHLFINFEKKNIKDNDSKLNTPKNSIIPSATSSFNLSTPTNSSNSFILPPFPLQTATLTKFTEIISRSFTHAHSLTYSLSHSLLSKISEYFQARNYYEELFEEQTREFKDILDKEKGSNKEITNTLRSKILAKEMEKKMISLRLKKREDEIKLLKEEIVEKDNKINDLDLINQENISKIDNLKNSLDFANAEIIFLSNEKENLTLIKHKLNENISMMLEDKFYSTFYQSIAFYKETIKKIENDYDEKINMFKDQINILENSNSELNEINQKNQEQLNNLLIEKENYQMIKNSMKEIGIQVHIKSSSSSHSSSSSLKKVTLEVPDDKRKKKSKRSFSRPSEDEEVKTVDYSQSTSTSSNPSSLTNSSIFIKKNKLKSSNTENYEDDFNSFFESENYEKTENNNQNLARNLPSSSSLSTFDPSLNISESNEISPIKSSIRKNSNSEKIRRVRKISKSTKDSSIYEDNSENGPYEQVEMKECDVDEKIYYQKEKRKRSRPQVRNSDSNSEETFSKDDVENHDENEVVTERRRSSRKSLKIDRSTYRIDEAEVEDEEYDDEEYDDDDDVDYDDDDDYGLSYSSTNSPSPYSTRPPSPYRREMVTISTQTGELDDFTSPDSEEILKNNPQVSLWILKNGINDEREKISELKTVIEQIKRKYEKDIEKFNQLFVRVVKKINEEVNKHIDEKVISLVKVLCGRAMMTQINNETNKLNNHNLKEYERKSENKGLKALRERVKAKKERELSLSEGSISESSLDDINREEPSNFENESEENKNFNHKENSISRNSSTDNDKEQVKDNSSYSFTSLRLNELTIIAKHLLNESNHSTGTLRINEKDKLEREKVKSRLESILIPLVTSSACQTDFDPQVGEIYRDFDKRNVSFSNTQIASSPLDSPRSPREKEKSIINKQIEAYTQSYQTFPERLRLTTHRLPHEATPHFISYLRKNEKVLSRENGLLKVALREYHGNYLHVVHYLKNLISKWLSWVPPLGMTNLSNVTTSHINTALNPPQKSSSPLKPALKSSLKSHSTPSQSTIHVPPTSQALWQQSISDLQSTLKELEDSEWIFNPNQFIKNVYTENKKSSSSGFFKNCSYNPHIKDEDPIDVATQSRLLLSYRHQIEELTNKFSSPSASSSEELPPLSMLTLLSQLVSDLVTRLRAQGGWRALLYRTDGSIDLSMNIEPFTKEEQVEIMKEKYDYLFHQFAYREKELLEAISNVHKQYSQRGLSLTNNQGEDAHHKGSDIKCVTLSRDQGCNTDCSGDGVIILSSEEWEKVEENIKFAQNVTQQALLLNVSLEEVDPSLTSTSSSQVIDPSKIKEFSVLSSLHKKFNESIDRSKSLDYLPILRNSANSNNGTSLSIFDKNSYNNSMQKLKSQNKTGVSNKPKWLSWRKVEDIAKSSVTLPSVGSTTSLNSSTPIVIPTGNVSNLSKSGSIVLSNRDKSPGRDKSPDRESEFEPEKQSLSEENKANLFKSINFLSTTAQQLDQTLKGVSSNGIINPIPEVNSQTLNNFNNMNNSNRNLYHKILKKLNAITSNSSIDNSSPPLNDLLHLATIIHDKFSTSQKETARLRKVMMQLNKTHNILNHPLFINYINKKKLNEMSSKGNVNKLKEKELINNSFSVSSFEINLDDSNPQEITNKYYNNPLNNILSKYKLNPPGGLSSNSTSSLPPSSANKDKQVRFRETTTLSESNTLSNSDTGKKLGGHLENDQFSVQNSDSEIISEERSNDLENFSNSYSIDEIYKQYSDDRRHTEDDDEGEDDEYEDILNGTSHFSDEIET